MDILAFLREVKKGNVSVEEHAHKIVEDAEKIDKDYAYFNTLAKEQAYARAKEIDTRIKQKKKIGVLAGLPFSAKDCIVTKGVESTAGSAILKGYVPPFNATVVERLLQEDAILLGKTAQDEFGFGSFSVNVGKSFRIPRNPFDKERSTGGSSGGAAGFTQKTSFAHVALAESTGGSIVNPASFCGVVGLCPTYGLVSRYGLIDYGNSLDKIGPMTKTVEECAFLLEHMTGQDRRDATSAQQPKQEYLTAIKEKKKRKIAIVTETFGDGVAEKVKKKVLSALEKAHVDYEEVSLSFVQKYSVAVYYLLAMAESSTNLAKYCGMRYGAHEPLQGNFNEYFTKVRSAHFGDEAKRRILLGTFTRMAGFREAYYIKAAKVRTKIIDEYKRVFKTYDALVSPTMPLVAPRLSEIETLTPLQQYLLDIMTVGPNVAGLPHISVPAGTAHDLPVGLMITGDHFKESTLLQIAKTIEETR